MMNTPVTVGLIQEAVTADSNANIEHAVERVRDAASRGAQIISLQELFNAPYFCKAESCDRFDIAEPIPGPTTEHMQRLARELAIVLVAPIFERQA
ncbi:MAG: nitrilase-related carbon-nitrogen hydrolase, partial [Thermoanaerobaculia bacterium]